jgi:hypothetical protein
MLTILAWMVFIPAIFWNIILFMVVFGDIVATRKIKWMNFRNMVDLVLSLAVLIIPGVYLFGWM